MANAKISALTDGTTAEATDKIPVERGGANRYITPGYIKTLAFAGSTTVLGGSDAASPVAQTIGVQNVVTGTTNTAGANFTIKGSQGTGTGAGGRIIFQVAPGGTTGTSQNALSNALNVIPGTAADRFIVTVGNPATFANYQGLGMHSLMVGTFNNMNDPDFYNGNRMRLYNSNTLKQDWYATGYDLASDIVINWSSTTASTGSKDISLTRDAASVLAQRSGTNAQTFRVYNTYTDASNYERGFTRWNSNVFEVGTEAAGTGTARALSLVSGTGSITIPAGTVTTSQPALDITQTWNAGAVTFTGLKFNVTNTASASASLLMDLQVGGNSYFNVRKDGRLTLVGYGSNTLTIDTLSGSKSTLTGERGIDLIPGAGWNVGLVGATVISGNNPLTLTNVVIRNDAAHVLAQRDGTNPQTFRVYNTYTDASNYERGFIRWNSNVFEVGTAAAGTGTNRALSLISATGVTSIDSIALTANGSAGSPAIGRGTSGLYFSAANGSTYITTGGSYFGAFTVSPQVFQIRQTALFGFESSGAASAIDVLLHRTAAGVLGIRGGNTTTGGALSFIEQTAPSAPATNGVYIYAEDNGSGKTRLMALFPTGAAQQIAIEP